MNVLTLIKSPEEMKRILMDIAANKRKITVVVDPEDLISVLMRHNSGAKHHNISMEEYAKHANSISNLLEAVEKDYNTHYMMNIYREASRRAGCCIGPLNRKVLQKFVNNGCKPKVSKCLKYTKKG